MPNESMQPNSNCGYLRMKTKCYVSFQLMRVIVFFFEELLNCKDISIKLFGPNYLINRTVSYFFWPIGTVKK